MLTVSPESKKRNLTLINVCLGQFMGAVDARSMIVALPTLSVYFGTSMEVVQWIPLAYQLTIIGLVLTLGRLGDMLGRKKFYNSGFLIFFFGSALCGLATTMTQIIIFRMIEGIGAAMIFANGRAIISTVFAKEGRGKALGITSMAFHLGYILGPSLGGFLIDSLGWRWIFFVNLPVALSGAVMGWRVVEETVVKKTKYSLDPAGMTTLFLTVICLILGLQQVTKSGLGILTGALFSLSLLSLVLFVYSALRVSTPLLDLGLFRSRLFTAGIISLFLVSLCQTATFFLLPFYLQGLLAFTPTQVGLTLIVFSVVVVFLAPIGGWLSDRLGSRLLCTLGTLFTFLGILIMSRLQAGSGYIQVVIPLMGMGVGWSLFASPNLSAILSSAPSDRLGAVSGMTVTSANVANGIGVALGSLFFIRWLGYYGVDFGASRAYTEWSHNPEAFLSAFQNSWMGFSVFALLAVVASVVRGGQVNKTQSRAG